MLLPLFFTIVDYITILILGFYIGVPYILCNLLFHQKVNKNNIVNRDIYNNKKLVVLIHGTGVYEWQWLIAKLYLDIYNISYISVNYDYNQKIEKSSNDVLTLLESYSSDYELILIGHSQGGLIVRYIYDKLPNVRFGYLMNTPQRGFYLLDPLVNCGILNIDSYCDMATDSDFVNNLRYDENDNIHEIIGKYDFIPAESSLVYKKNIYLSWGSHYFSAINPNLWINFIIPNIKG